MGVWPRKRAARPVARVRSWNRKQPGLLAFPAYKAGMTHVMAIDTRKSSATKGETLALAATILEAPPVRIHTVRCYGKDAYGKRVVQEHVLAVTKGLGRRLHTKKADPKKLEGIDPAAFEDITVTLITQPEHAGFGKKRPEVLEAALGGTNEEKLAWIKERVGKDIQPKDVFAEGEHVDAHGITTGRGTQGPVKRFGIGLKHHKTEKGRRTPGTLGGWSGQQHFMYRVAHAGQTGYHQRTQYNTMVLKLGDDPEDVNPKGGIIRYGLVKAPYILVRGSVMGAKKRLITLTKATRLHDEQPLPTIEAISKESHQGR